jgi:hypothetical protein
MYSICRCIISSYYLVHINSLFLCHMCIRYVRTINVSFTLHQYALCQSTCILSQLVVYVAQQIASFKSCWFYFKNNIALIQYEIKHHVIKYCLKLWIQSTKLTVNASLHMKSTSELIFKLHNNNNKYLKRVTTIVY